MEHWLHGVAILGPTQCKGLPHTSPGSSGAGGRDASPSFPHPRPSSHKAPALGVLRAALLSALACSPSANLATVPNSKQGSHPSLRVCRGCSAASATHSPPSRARVHRLGSGCGSGQPESTACAEVRGQCGVPWTPLARLHAGIPYVPHPCKGYCCGQAKRNSLCPSILRGTTWLHIPTQPGKRLFIMSSALS